MARMYLQAGRELVIGQADANTQRAWRFFLEHAGYATTPGRAACAIDLVRAEARAQAAGFTFEWEWDADADLSWMDEAEAAKEHEILGCVCLGPDGKHVTSLWGIVDADANYRRVIEAELASKALEAYTPAVCGCP